MPGRPLSCAIIACALTLASAPAFAGEFTWANPNGGGLWNVANNWIPTLPADAGKVPKLPGDSAKILNAGGFNASITVDIDPTLFAFDFNSKNSSFKVFSHTITVNSTSPSFATLTNARALFVDSTWAGNVTFTNAIPLPDGTFTVQGTSVISAPFVNTGAMEINGSMNGATPISANLSVGSFENKGRLRLNAALGLADASITVGGGAGTLTNSNLMEVELLSGGSRSMEGVLVNNNGATLNVKHNFNLVANQTTGHHINNGIIEITSPTATFTPFGATFTNSATGEIKGKGKLNRNQIPGKGFVNAGKIAPGLSAGTLTIEGDYDEISTASLDIEIGGPTPDLEHDQLIINGHATLAGTLNVSLIDNFDGNGSFVILDASNGIEGRFFNAPLDGALVPASGGTFQVHYVQGSGSHQLVILDNFIAPIPEPSSALLVLAGIPLLFRKKRRISSNKLKNKK